MQQMQRVPDPMQWLASGVPLTLLIDLLDARGPLSRAILDREPADARWIPPRSRAA